MTNIDEALIKLNTLLPLAERQQSLSPADKKIHQSILHDFVKTGAASPDYDRSSLDVLSDKDLIVLDKESGVVTGAYPFCSKSTPHHVFMNDFITYAMCALDAIAIAPVFNQTTLIKSVCHVTKDTIEIKQNGNEITNEHDCKDVHVGIRWQDPGSCAAESLCMEMVFLKNANTAEDWLQRGHDKSVFNLNDAIEFATRYFSPLIEN
jgi:hypothetical protein